MTTFTMPDFRRMSPEESNPMNALISRAMEGYKKGTELSYLPQQLQTDIQAKQAASQKNMIMAKLLQSLMGGEGGGLDLVGNAPGANANQSNLKQAALKAFTGIDLNARSPEQMQELKIATDLKNAANKNNLTTGASDVSREFLQNKVSMPQEYMGITGSATMGKDILAAKLGDKDAEERLIQAAVAEKLVPEYSGFQLMSQGQKATVSALKHQQEAIRQGWPTLSKKITNNLPANLQKEAERRHNEIVKNVNKTRESFYTSGGKERPSFSQETNTQNNMMQSHQPSKNDGNKDQIENNNEDFNFALDLAYKIKEKTGKDVPENLILNYMWKHKGPIHIPSLLKAVGAQ